MTTTAKDQVQRLLALVPYLREHDGVPVEQAAADFGVPPQQVTQDLHVLWFCGLPGAMPGDLIEVDIDALEGEGVVRLSNADFLSRPLRLDAQEAVALTVALRTLREAGAAGERAAVDRALAKLESAAGAAAAPAEHVEVRIDAADPSVAEVVNRALQESRCLRLGYHVPARDETTIRDVDPMRLVVTEGHTYLEAWCRRVEDVRLFRLDRITEVELLDVPAAPPPQAKPRDLSGGLFQPSADDLLATVELLPAARWFAEYYPCESVEHTPDGGLRVTLRVSDPAWLRRLVLRLGGAARVTDPPDLADSVREAAAQALAAYER